MRAKVEWLLPVPGYRELLGCGRRAIVFERSCEVTIFDSAAQRKRFSDEQIAPIEKRFTRIIRVPDPIAAKLQHSARISFEAAHPVAAPNISC
jgi:hypothetical protein